MTYTAYNGALPNPATQAGTAFGQSIRDNVKVLRDYLAAMGMVPGWKYYAVVGTGSAEQPQYFYYRKGATGEVIRVTPTWGSSGGEAGNATKMNFAYASNESHASFPTTTNGTYEGMIDDAGYYVMTLTYDSNGNCTATTWGTS